MYLRFGNYTHAINECTVTISRTPLINEGGQHYAFTERWQITGMLLPAAQTVAAVTQAIAALQNAYVQFPGASIGIFADDGTATAHGILASNTIGGIRVVDGPTFPTGDGSEYTTYRSYSITIEATIPMVNVANVLLAFVESLSFEGGGERWAYQVATRGLPQKQQLAEATPQRIVQSGRAIGYLQYPVAMPPLFPADEHIDQRRITVGSPKRSGPLGSPFWTEFPIEWTYTFEVAIGGLAYPNRWI